MKKNENDFVSCCAWLADSINEAGEKGFGVVPVHDSARRAFVLQARPFDRKTLSSLDKSAELRQISVAVQMQMHLKFCTHCGADLESLLAGQLEAFDRLARSMAHLIETPAQ